MKPIKNSSNLSIIKSFALFLLIIQSVVYATIIRVPADSSTIQAGINGAMDNDTVLVADGLFKGAGNKNIKFNGKAILLTSENGAQKTIIDCENNGRAFEFINYEDKDSRVVGFTIQNGNMPSGGGFLCENSSPTIDSCIIINNTASELYGGGIFCQYSDAVITNCTLKRNSSSFGGAIYVRLGGSPQIIGNVIDSNMTKHQGGGIGTTNSPTPLIENNTITRNIARDGGGINCGAANIRNNIIMNNIAYSEWNSLLLGYGGGIAINAVIMPPVENNIIAHNKAHSDGGGIICHSYSSVFRNNIICFNIAGDGTVPSEIRVGGGIRFTHAAGNSSTITNCTFYNNRADDQGGCLFARDSCDILLRKCVFSGNFSGYGGVVYDTMSSNVAFDSCLIIDNGSTRNSNSGFVYSSYEGGTLQGSHSHIYYNTFQPDKEIINNTENTFTFKKNFWWDTSSSYIESLFQGNADFSPYLPIMIASGVPGEPTVIDSVRNYSDSTYTTLLDSISENDSLYLRIYGADRNSNLREVGIAILKSAIYNSGIAVALLETDTNSGVYEGIALPVERTNVDSIRIDDVYQKIGVRDGVDTIAIIANIDTNKVFYVKYNSIVSPVKYIPSNKISQKVRIMYSYISKMMRIVFSIPEKSNVEIIIYNCLGRSVKEFNISRQKGYNEFNLTTTQMNTGIYFVSIHSNSYYCREKFTLVR